MFAGAPANITPMKGGNSRWLRRQPLPATPALLSLEVATPEKQKIDPFDTVIHVQESPPHKRLLRYTK